MLRLISEILANRWGTIKRKIYYYVLFCVIHKTDYVNDKYYYTKSYNSFTAVVVELFIE